MLYTANGVVTGDTAPQKPPLWEENSLTGKALHSANTGDTAPQKRPPFMGGKLNNWSNTALDKYSDELEELRAFTAFTYDTV